MGNAKLILVLIIYMHDNPIGRNDDSAEVCNAKLATRSGFSKSESMEMVNLHNEYRALVVPVPSDMNRLMWNTHIASEARNALANCSLDEKDLRHSVLGKIGWNEHIADTRNVTAVFMAWYSENEYYDNFKSECKQNFNCSNYVQMMSSKARYIGCYWNQCFNDSYLVGCGYSPQYNIRERLYHYGTPPCSRCVGTDGGKCYKFLCTANDLCDALNITCACDLECQHEGILNKTTCTCKCSRLGSQTLDCSSDVCYDCYDDTDKGIRISEGSCTLNVMGVALFAAVWSGYYY